MRLVVSLVLIAVLFSGLTVWRARSVTARDEVRYPPEGQFLTVDGVRLHAVVAGTGPDLVLIHGASGSVRDFTFGLLPRLAERYRVIAIDRPGFGWSDPAPGIERLEPQARILRDAARQLGAARPIVVGYSYGGAVALSWATHFPDDLSALVLLSSPSHEWPGGMPLYYQLTSPPVIGRVFRTLIEAWVTDQMVEDGTRAVFSPQAMSDAYARHFGPRMSLRETTARINAWQRAAIKDEIRAMIPTYPSIRVPTVILHGGADETVYASIHSEKLVKEVPGAELKVLPDIGHMIQHAAQDEVVAAIDRAAARAAAE